MDKQSAKKLAKLLEFEKDFKTNPAVATLSEIGRVDFAIEQTDNKVEEVAQAIETIQSDSLKVVNALNQLDQTKADKEDVAQQIENIARMPGRPGNPGPAGKDYIITERDYKEIAKKVEVPVVEKVIERTEVIKEQPIIKTEVVKEIKTDLEPEVIRDRLESLKEENRLDASAIKGLERFQKTVNTAIQTVGNRVAGVSKIVAGSNVTISSTNPNGTGEVTVNATVPPSANAFTDLTDTFSDYTGLAGQGLRVNATEDGIDTYTPTDTDEKVKYDAGDPTAGYVADKFVAGTGISLAEGTGANENKLVITSTATESDTLDSVTDRGATTSNTIDVGGVVAPSIQAKTSAGLTLKADNGDTAVLIGAGGGKNATFYDGVKLDAQTADRILATDSSKNIQALNTTTYPSLTELAYVKGVTSGIQTQLGNKFDKTTDDTDDITDTATNRFTNDTDITRLANTSGTNTGDVSVTDSSEIDFTLTGQNITASLKSGSIDETKLDTSVNASLDLADTALQSFTETDPVFGASEAANFAAGDKSKLDGIEAGAEVNVNADWNAVTGDAVILNKPSIPSQYTDELAQDAVGNAVGNGLDYDDTSGAISVDETELAHNSLGSKQGGTTNEYYHLTAAQHTVVGNTSGTNTGDQDLSGYFNKSADDTDDITEGTTNLFDKTVSISAGTGISVSGTYPNFTVTNNVTDTGITQLTGDVTAGPGNGSQAASIATGAVTNTKIGTAAVTYDKIQHVTAERLLGRYSGTDGDVQEIQLGTGLSFSGGTLNTSSSPGSAVWGSISGDIEDQTDLNTLLENLKKCVISVNINARRNADGSQGQIVAGTKSYIKIPYGGTIVGWVVTEVSPTPKAGSIVIDVVKDTTVNYPPTGVDSIAGTEKPTLSSQTNNTDTTLTTWTTSVAANDYLGFIVDSVDGCSNILLQVLINKI